MPAETRNFIQKNWTILLWVIGAIFAAGGIFAEFQFLQSEIEVIDGRLNKKIEILNEIDTRVEELERYHEYQRGYNDAKREIEKK
jgi:hypothetical protein